MPIHESRLKQNRLAWVVLQTTAVVGLIVLLAASRGHTQGTGTYGSEDVLDPRYGERVDTSDRVLHRCTDLCTASKGEASDGLRAICTVDQDTLVLGQPAIIRFGIVNVGPDAAGVYRGPYRQDGASPVVLYVADPSGIEYPYCSPHLSGLTAGPLCRDAVAISPGDSLTGIWQFTYYKDRGELLFPFPGRWGLYVAYYMPGRDCLRSAKVASAVSWIEVVKRDSLDAAAWDTFEHAERAVMYCMPSTKPRVVSAFEDVVEKYPESAYYRYSLYMYAGCLQAEGKYDEAIQYFERFRKEYPTSLLAAEALFRIAQCLHELGRTARAVMVFDQAHEADKSNWKGGATYRPLYGPWPWHSGPPY
jgi:hypothetical protein